MDRCELCETIKTRSLVDDVNIKKFDENTYELQLWEVVGEGSNEQYKISYSLPIKYCPDCGRKLGE